MVGRGVAMLCAVLALSGCASQASIVGRDNFDLCRSATIGELVGADSLSRAEALKRGLIVESEWPIMVDRRLEVGMSECAALAILRGGADVKGVDAPFKFGADNRVIMYVEDPRVPPVSYVNYMRRRAAEVCYTPTSCYTKDFERATPILVPKYMMTFNKGKLTACNSVDFAKIDAKTSNEELFTLPCVKDVPGFEKR